jgi:hypothetical protein
MFANIKFIRKPEHKVEHLTHIAEIPGENSCWSLRIYLNNTVYDSSKPSFILKVQPLFPAAPFKLGTKFNFCVGAEKVAEGEIVHMGSTDEMLVKLEERVNELTAAIYKHREQTGHNMCWENDEELWAVLNDGVKIDHTAPNWCEFMTKCAEYRASNDK